MRWIEYWGVIFWETPGPMGFGLYIPFFQCSNWEGLPVENT